MPLSNVEPANINPMPAAPVEPSPPIPTEPLQVQTSPEHQPEQQPVPDHVPQPVPAPVPVQPVPVQPTGNTVLDAAAKIIAAGGFDPVAISNEISTAGALSATTQEALESKLGKEQVALLLATYNTEVKTIRTQAEARRQSVYDAVGGKDTWDAIAQWTTTAEAGLSDTAASEYNKMLAAGGVQAELAAHALKEAYMATPGFKQEHPVMQQPTGVVPPAPNVTAISRRQYVEQRKQAIRAGNATEVTALDARAKHTMDNLPGQWRMSSIIN